MAELQGVRDVGYPEWRMIAVAAAVVAWERWLEADLGSEDGNLKLQQRDLAWARLKRSKRPNDDDCWTCSDYGHLARKLGSRGLAPLQSQVAD